MTDAPLPPPDPAARLGASAVPLAPAPRPPLFADGELVPYHRLYRTVPGYRWWRPLVAVVLLAVFLLIATAIASTVLMVVGILIGAIPSDPDGMLTALDELSSPDVASPFQLIFLLSSVAVWLPLVPLALLCAGLRPVGMASSVTLRLRWGWLLRCAVPAALTLGLGFAFLFGLLPLLEGSSLLAPTTDPATFAICAVIIVLLTPFQAAAEEYVFRGVAMQVLGSWTRVLPVAIVVPTLLFALGHLYDVWGLVDVAVFGIAAAIVTWRTGGLEAAIVVHTLNNVFAFLFLASGVLGTTRIEAEGGSLLSIGVTVVTMGLYLLVVDRMAARSGLARRARFVAPIADAGNS